MAMYESVYNLVPPDYVPPPKPKRYKSKYPGNLAPTSSTFSMSNSNRPPIANLGGDLSNTQPPSKINKSSWGDFGGHPTRDNLGRKIVNNSTTPPKFNQSKYRVASLSDEKTISPEKFNQSSSGKPRRRKPELPKEPPLLLPPSRKNFVVANAVDNILQIPPKISPPEKDYLNKVDYGKIPKYLNQVKEEVAQEKQLVESYLRERRRDYMLDSDGQLREFDEEEKEDLLNKLKTKWEEVNQKYQLLTHLNNPDTLRGIRQKETFEKKLDEIEESIKILKNKQLYIAC